MRLGKLKALSVIMFLFLAFLICKLPAKAAETYKAEITYRQSEARRMLDMVNDFRMGSDAWQWNENGEKVEVKNLQPLVYDYNLERIAMIRAKELVALYSHTRPDGTSCFTAYTGSYGWKAENIAISCCDSSAEGAFFLWKEDDKDYSGQGHRRAMLSEHYGAIGIAYVYYNGCHYWVQEFGDVPNETGYVPANDSETEAVFSLDSASLEKKVSVPSGVISVSVGETKDIPNATVKIRMKGTWASAPPIAEEVLDTVRWTSSDTEVLKVNGNTMTGVKNGEAEVFVDYNGTRLKVSVKVGWGNMTFPDSSGDLKRAGVTRIDESFIYNGEEHIPAVYVFYNGESLTLGEDYKITYKDNINAGTARIIVEGIGDYYGSTERTFMISPADISGAWGTVSQEIDIDGRYGSPVLTLYYGDVLLKEGQDYISEIKTGVDGKNIIMYGYGTGNYTGEYVSAGYSLLGEDTPSYDDSDVDDEYFDDSDTDDEYFDDWEDEDDTDFLWLQMGKEKYKFKYSGRKRSFKLPVKVSGGKVSYNSSKSAVKVNRKGKVTISGKFKGKAYIHVVAKGYDGTKISRKILIQVKK